MALDAAGKTSGVIFRELICRTQMQISPQVFSAAELEARGAPPTATAKRHSAVRASSHSMLQPSPSRRPVQDRINIGAGSVSPSFAPPAFQCDQLPAASHAQARIPIVAANQLAQVQLHDRLLTPPVGRSHVQDRIPMRPGTLMRTVAVRRDHVPSHYAMLGTYLPVSPCISLYLPVSP
jgi:hypothetical protein